MISQFLMSIPRFGEWAAVCAQDSAPAEKPGGGQTQLFMMLAVMAVAFWFIILRPQKKEKEARLKRLDALKKGDKVISIGGIHGKIADIDQVQGLVTVEVAPKITIKFSKSAIQTVNAKAGSAPDGRPDKDDEKTSDTAPSK
jgi:preprotein translocase subunit YajC